MSSLAIINHVGTETPFNQLQTRQIKFPCSLKSNSEDFVVDTQTGFVKYVGKKDKKLNVLFQFGLATNAKENEIHSFVNVNNSSTVPELASVVSAFLETNVSQQITLNDVITLKSNDVVSLGGFLKCGSTQTLLYSNVFAQFTELD